MWPISCKAIPGSASASATSSSVIQSSKSSCRSDSLASAMAVQPASSESGPHHGSSPLTSLASGRSLRIRRWSKRMSVTRFSFLLVFLLLDWMCSFRLYDTIFVLPAPKNTA